MQVSGHQPPRLVHLEPGKLRNVYPATYHDVCEPGFEAVHAVGLKGSPRGQRGRAGGPIRCMQHGDPPCLRLGGLTGLEQHHAITNQRPPFGIGGLTNGTSPDVVCPQLSAGEYPALALDERGQIRASEQ